MPHNSFQLMPQPSRLGSSRQYSRFGSPSVLMDISEVIGRPYDVVIFAASGSVGRFLVEEMALVVDRYYSSHGQHQQRQQQLMTGHQHHHAGVGGGGAGRDQASQIQARRRSVPRHINDIKWAVAGRSAANLSDTLSRAEQSTGIRGLSIQIPVLLADLNNHRSLLEMCSKTNLIINCAGPYSFDGEVVIKACLESKTSYIDLSHETNFNELMYRRYYTDAIKNGVYIINGCGFQSMSAEMGFNFIKLVADGKIEDLKVVLELNDAKAHVRSLSSSSSSNCLRHVTQSGIVSWGMWCSILMEQSLDFKKTNKKNSRDPIIAPTITSNHLLTNVKEVRYARSSIRKFVEFRDRKLFPWLKLIHGFGEYGLSYCLPMNNLTSEEAQLIRGELNAHEHRKHIRADSNPDSASTAPASDTATATDTDKATDNAAAAAGNDCSTVHNDSSGGDDDWRPTKFTSFVSIRSFIRVLIVVAWLLVFNICVKFCILRTLMRTFSSIFTLGCVTNNKALDRDSLSHIKFCQTFLAYGTRQDAEEEKSSKDTNVDLPDIGGRDQDKPKIQELLLVSRVVGPEPNHIATATYAIQAALTLVLEKEHLPKRGGVLTPGTAFSETNIIYRLRQRNIKFEVLKKT